jgi:DNA-binding NtrC family response regulator
MADVTRRIVKGAITVPRFHVEVIFGPDAGQRVEAVEGRLIVGTGEGATLTLKDPTVSRFHVELEATAEGIAIRDLGSTNGTHLEHTSVRDIAVKESVVLSLGGTKIQLQLTSDQATVPLSSDQAFGALLGGSPAMRAVYAALERAAPTNAPVLITGESGTGKELAARAIHSASTRSTQAFEVVDCGGLPPTLIESELFGHEKGAYTGAIGEREGAFERADGGTIFLDELGELPLEVQPKLLRALGEKEIRRVGAQKTKKIDVRVVAATNRDLRREVNSSRFRADLFYRLAVIQVRMPPLRERLEDLPILSRGLLDLIGKERGIDTTNVQLDASLWDHAWPGNIRELRNYLEQLAILNVKPALERPFAENEATVGGDALFQGLDQMPLTQAKNELTARFEARYVTRLLEKTKGNVAEAARLAGVNRATLFRMIRRYDLRGADGA